METWFIRRLEKLELIVLDHHNPDLNNIILKIRKDLGKTYKNKLKLYAIILKIILIIKEQLTLYKVMEQPHLFLIIPNFLLKMQRVMIKQ